MTPRQATISSSVTLHHLDGAVASTSNTEGTFSTPNPKYIDVAKGPRFSQSPIPSHSSTAVEIEDDPDADTPPLYNPRQSGLREDNSGDEPTETDTVEPEPDIQASPEDKDPKRNM